MLHLTLAANLLNAIGGEPVLDAPHLLPGYPRTLPHGDQSFQIELLPFGQQALESFLWIEQPSPPGAAPEADRYETIGQFYEAIERGFRHLCEGLGEDALFSGKPERQITDVLPVRRVGSHRRRSRPCFRSPGTDRDRRAGRRLGAERHRDGDHQLFHADRNEVAHYYRFEELKLGRRYQQGDTASSGPTGEAVEVAWDAVHPMRPNPRVADSPPGSQVRVGQEASTRRTARSCFSWSRHSTATRRCWGP